MKHQPNVRFWNKMILVACVFLAAGCAAPSHYPTSFTLGTAGQYQMTEEVGRVNVPMYFATDRQMVELAKEQSQKIEPKWLFQFTDERGELSLGQAVVTIGQRFQIGHQNKDLPKSVREQMVLLDSVEVMDEQAFIDSVNKKLEEVGKRDIVVIVHGYNEKFDGFMEWVGQLAYEISYEGVVVVYSWPSWGRLSAYTVDENNVQWTVPNLVKLINLLDKKVDAENVHLLSHSMGARALSGALMLLAYGVQEGDKPHFGEVIFAAPDIDADVLASRVPIFKPLAERFTIYRSATDIALRASETVHGKYVRAGQSGETVTIIDGVDTIDASFVDDSTLGHVYVAQTRAVVQDLFMLLNHRLPPEQRNLLKAEQGGRSYWIIRP